MILRMTLMVVVTHFVFCVSAQEKLVVSDVLSEAVKKEPEFYFKNQKALKFDKSSVEIGDLGMIGRRLAFEAGGLTAKLELEFGKEPTDGFLIQFINFYGEALTLIVEKANIGDGYVVNLMYFGKGKKPALLQSKRVDSLASGSWTIELDYGFVKVTPPNEKSHLIKGYEPLFDVAIRGLACSVKKGKMTWKSLKLIGKKEVEYDQRKMKALVGKQFESRFYKQFGADEFELAIRTAKEATLEYSEIYGASHPYSNIWLTRLGEVYAWAGKAEQAIDLLNKQLQELNFAPTHPLKGEVYVHLGKAYTKFGLDAKASLALNKAISIFKLYPNLSEKLGLAHSNLGQLHLESNRFQAAKQSFSDALSAYPRNSYRNISIAYQNRCVASCNLNNFDDALRDLEEAKKQASRGELSETERMHLTLDQLFLESQFKDPSLVLDKLSKLKLPTESSVEIAASYANVVSCVAFKNGDVDRAFKVLDEFVAKLEPNSLSPNAEIGIRSNHAFFGAVAKQENAVPRYHEWIEKQIVTFQSFYNSMSRSQKTGIASTLLSECCNLIHFSFDAEFSDQKVYETILNVRNLLTNTKNQEISEVERKLRQRLANIYLSSPRNEADLRNMLRAKKQSLLELEKIQSASTNVEENAKPFSASKLLEQLEDSIEVGQVVIDFNEVILPRYFKGKQKNYYVAFVSNVDADGKLKVEKIKLAESDIVNKELTRFYNAIEGYSELDTASDSLEKLSLSLWKPLKEHLRNINQITIVAENKLNRVPWYALTGEAKKTVVDQHEIRLVNRVEHFATKPETIDEKAKLGAVLNVDYGIKENSRWSPVSIDSKQFLKKFSNSGQRYLLEKQDASEKRVKEIFGECNVLCFHTHGYVAKEIKRSATYSPLNKSFATGFTGLERFYFPSLSHAIVLANANQDSINHEVEDGYLTAFEMSGLKLNSCELVYLSCCHAGLGTSLSGLGVAGINRSLTVDAGAERVISSMWQADSKVANQISDHFFEEYLKNKKPAATALRQALIKYRKNAGGDGNHPAFWANFFMVGKW